MSMGIAMHCRAKSGFPLAKPTAWQAAGRRRGGLRPKGKAASGRRTPNGADSAAWSCSLPRTASPGAKAT